jgi:hypothetical protein
MHSRFIKNLPIDLDAINPSFLRWFCHTSPSLSSSKLIQALLRQHVHTLTSFLKFYTPSSYWANMDKVDIGYYAPVDQTTLDLCVFLCFFTLTTLHPPSPH